MTAYDPDRDDAAHGETARPNTADRPLSALLSELATETTTLVRKEVELARAEVTEKVNQATAGAVSLAAGGLVTFAGVLFLLLALTYGLANWMPMWLSALIVGAVVAVIGGIMILVGRKKLTKRNLQPNRTLETLREDKDWAKSQLGR